MDSRRLNIPFLLWWRLYRQLRHRSGGVRESGAFLLGRRGEEGIDEARTFACYDDLDPSSLAKGYVDFHSTGFANLWTECRRLNLDVLADVHTHPGNESAQSEIDRTNPMIGEQGHVAIIVPTYAQGWYFQLGKLSVYEYQQNYHWSNWSGSDRHERVRFTWW
jgi:proteasome lid subunit RPN8/RPN11